MYKTKFWQEEKWDIHSSEYHTSKYEHSGSDHGIGYSEQKYGSKDGDLSSDYLKKNDSAENDEKKERLFSDLEETSKKEDLKEEDLPFKAAKQVFNESRNEPKKIQPKKDVKTIDDAIKKAIEQEKKVIMMD